MARGVHPNSKRNLRPAKKGEVRNPAGASKLKGQPTFKSILTKLLEGQVSVEEAGKLKKMTRREVLSLQLAKDAMDARNTANERTRANQAIQDRVEGKPVQPLSTASGTDIALIISSSENRL